MMEGVRNDGGRTFAWCLALAAKVKGGGHEGTAMFRCCALPASLLWWDMLPKRVCAGSFAAPQPTKGPVRTILRPINVPCG
jgi:hypothetical protein